MKYIIPIIVAFSLSGCGKPPEPNTPYLSPTTYCGCQYQGQTLYLPTGGTCQVSAATNTCTCEINGQDPTLQYAPNQMILNEVSLGGCPLVEHNTQ